MISSLLRHVPYTGWCATRQARRMEMFLNRRKIVTFRSAGTKTTSLKITKSPKIIETPTVRRQVTCEEIERLGLPRSSIIQRCTNYVVSYSTRTRVPEYVIEHLNQGNFEYDANTAGKRSKCNFYQEKAINRMFRSANADYRGSGFDRGHLASAANHCRCRDEVKETFSLINVAPQVGDGFNRGPWRRLEKHIRNLVPKFQCVYICTGTLFLPEVVGDDLVVSYKVIGNGVAVPTHFFKVIAGITNTPRQISLESYVMPNKVIDNFKTLDDFKMELEVIERYSGLTIFEEIRKTGTRNIYGARKLDNPQRRTR